MSTLSCEPASCVLCQQGPSPRSRLKPQSSFTWLPPLCTTLLALFTIWTRFRAKTYSKSSETANSFRGALTSSTCKDGTGRVVLCGVYLPRNLFSYWLLSLLQKSISQLCSLLLIPMPSVCHMEPRVFDSRFANFKSSSVIPPL